VIGRLGGDEFGVILTQTDYQRAKDKSKALSALVENAEIVWGGQTFFSRITCGVIEIKTGLTADEALASADSAMYSSKLRR
jgi:diguanylate cyclase (GGDEF)-like protein